MNKSELKEHMPRLGKHFLRMLKNHGLYGKFLQQRKASGNMDFQHMMDTVMKKANQDMAYRGINDNDPYQYIIGVLNTMLHLFVENGLGIHPDKIGKLGQEIFEDFCIELFGEEKFKEYNEQHSHCPSINEQAMKELYTLFQERHGEDFMEFPDFARLLMSHSRPMRKNRGEEEVYYSGINRNVEVPF